MDRDDISFINTKSSIYGQLYSQSLNNEAYALDAASFDFSESRDVVFSVLSRYGTNRPTAISLETLPPLFYLLLGLGMFLIGTSFGALNVYGLDKGPNGPVTPSSVPIPATPGQGPCHLVGENFYKSNCAACHQASGLGQAGNVPPLAGSDWVQGDANRLVCILTKGLQGPVRVNGVTYNAQMPAYPFVPPDKLADLLTYIRKDWTNKAPPVTEDVVTKERAAAPPPAGGAYTEDELLKIQ